MRGFTYMFENSTGGSHPFRIQFTGTTTGVGTYVSGSKQEYRYSQYHMMHQAIMNINALCHHTPV